MPFRIAVFVLFALSSALVLHHRPVDAGAPVRDANFFVRGFGSDSSDDRVVDVAISADSVYVCGLTDGNDFPISAGAYDTRHDGDYDAFVMRLGRGGNLLWSTYLGSPGTDFASGIDVDEDGNVLVCGTTNHAAFPTTPGSLRQQFAGNQEGFVAKLSPDGSTLLSSTFVGGNDTDGAARLRCGPDGTVYVGGTTESPDFPKVNATQSSLSGGQDAFVLQLDATGSSALWSTYFGGNIGEAIGGLDLAADGSVWITGFTTSTSFPTVEPVQATYGGGFTDGFVARFSPTGAVEFATYLGGAGFDFGNAIAADANGRAHVAGGTDANAFPTTPNAEQSQGAGLFEGFYATFDRTVMEYATLIGGAGDDQAVGIAASDGIIAMTGAGGPGFPATDGAAVKGTSDGFIAYLKPDGERFETRLFGGSGNEVGRSIVLDEDSIAAVAAGTTSTDIGEPSISGPNEDAAVLFARSILDPSTAEQTDLLVDVRPVAKTVNGRYTACFEIEIKNQGPATFIGGTFGLFEITSSPCDVESFGARIVESPPGERPIFSSESPRTFLIIERLRKGGSIIVEICCTPATTCRPGEGIVCSARLSPLEDLKLENNYDVDQVHIPEAVPGKQLFWNFTSEGFRLASVNSPVEPPMSPPGFFDAFRPAGIEGFRIYASTTPDFVPSPASLAMEINDGDARSIPLDASSTNFYRVTPVRIGNEEGPPSNEVGGPLPEIVSVVQQGQKLVVLGSGFEPGTQFTLGGLELVPAPKLKNEGTKVVQKLRFSIPGLTISDLVLSGESARYFVHLGNDNFLMFRH